MRQAIIYSLTIALMVGGLGCASSSTTRNAETGPAKSQGHGPPPHAPAHGYRAKTLDGTELDFRSDLGVYVVVGVSDYFFHDGVFYHRDGNGWIAGQHVDGPWTRVTESQLPPGLRSKSKGKAKGQTR